MKNRFLAITLSSLVSGFALTSVGHADLAIWEFTGVIDHVPIDATDFQRDETFTFRFTINYGTFGEVHYSPTPGDLDVTFPNALSDVELAFEHGLVLESATGSVSQSQHSHTGSAGYSGSGSYIVVLLTGLIEDPRVLIPPDQVFGRGGRLFISDSTSDDSVQGEITDIHLLAQFAVPEPSTYGVIGSLLLIGLVAARRRSA